MHIDTTEYSDMWYSYYRPRL